MDTRIHTRPSIHISGNTIADSLARNGANFIAVTEIDEEIDPREVFIIIKEKIFQTYYYLNTITKGKHLREILKIYRTPFYENSKMIHNEIKTLNRLHLMKIKDSSNCERCQSGEIDDDTHILFNCSIYFWTGETAVWKFNS